MTDDRRDLATRVAHLEAELGKMQARLADLDQRFAAGAPSPPPKAKERLRLGGGEEDASEEILSWVGQAALLPRVATLCFLLVVALGLRTVTDNQLLDPGLGSILGLVYAGGLIAWGAFSYKKRSALAPVFTVCGTLLVFTVIVETHARFAALPSVPAYALLVIAGAAAAAISHVHRVAPPVFAGSLGMGIAGIALDYPNPTFLYLAAVLLAANLCGALATRLQRCSWLRWLVLALTLFMLQVWSIKLRLFVGRQGTEGIPFDLVGFYPVVGVFFFFYLGISLAGMVWHGQGRVAKFDLALPAIVSLWSFLVVAAVAGPGGGIEVLGWVGVTAAVGMFALAHWLGGRASDQPRGTNAFSLAGALLVAMALPRALGQPLLALTLLSACAFALAWLAGRWQSGGVRVTSYLLQLYACGALVLELWSTQTAEPSLVSALAAGALAVIGLVHYRWARQQAPPPGSLAFSRFDGEDRSAVLLLLAALVSAFFTLRVGIYQGLEALDVREPGAFACYQSVLINVSAVALMVLAYLRRSKELRNVAILVTLIGGAKVFFGDLFAARGVALVLSVFSFGVAAAVESILLSRWQPSSRDGGGFAGDGRMLEEV